MDPLTDNDSSNMGVTRYEGFQFVPLLYIPKDDVYMLLISQVLLQRIVQRP